jgi:HSP20 family protein
MTIVRSRKNQDYFPAFANLVDNFFGKEFALANERFNFPSPAVNIKETEDGFQLQVSAPGFSKENISISMKNNLLTLHGNVESQDEVAEEKYTRKEFTTRSFERSFTLPTIVDGERIEARYVNGILHVNLPKKEEAKVKPERLISIA